MKMFFKRIFDKPTIQAYSVNNPTKEWLKKYPRKNVVVLFNLYRGEVSIKNTDTLPVFDFIGGCGYIFSTQPPKRLVKELCYINTPPTDITTKRCGFNPSNSELLTAENNVVLSIFSMYDRDYPPSYTTESIFITSNYDEFTKTVSNKNIHEIISKVMEKHIEQTVPKNLVAFITALQESFPLNYGGTIRRYGDVIDKKSLSQKITGNDFYIGYDCRCGDTSKEILVSKLMETCSYKPSDTVRVYETYNNPMEHIQEVCDKNHIKYSFVHKHCITVNSDDYEKLSQLLVARLSDFIA